MDVKGNVATLKELVAYQDGAVVSRTLIEKTTGTITLFAFAEGQGLSEHSAPYDALIQILDGEAEVILSDEPHHTREGESIIFPANAPPSLKAEKPFKMMVIMIRS